MSDNRCEARVCVGPKVCQQVGDQMAELRLESELPCVWNGLSDFVEVFPARTEDDLFVGPVLFEGESESLDDFLKNAETR